jgi:hypothetical protein
MYGRVSPTDRSDVQMCLYDSFMDSHGHGRPPPCPRGRWCARVETVDRPIRLFIINFFWRRFVLDDPPYTHEGLYDHGDRSK